MKSGEVGRIIGSAIEGFTVVSVHPTFEDAERTEIGATLGDEVTVEKVDCLLAEKRQRDREDETFLALLKAWNR